LCAKKSAVHSLILGIILGGMPILIACGKIGAVFQEQLHSLHMTMLQSQVQGAVLLLVNGIHVSSEMHPGVQSGIEVMLKFVETDQSVFAVTPEPHPSFFAHMAETGCEFCK